MPNVLLIEDSPEFQFLVKKSLGERYELTCVSRASEALREVSKRSFDLILLDVGLPDGDGFELCARIREKDATSETPILFLTGRGSVPDRIQGFEQGGDDYITKPFDPLELRARVDARFRKSKGAARAGETLRMGGLRLDVPYQRAFTGSDDRDLGLTPIEFKILFFFLRNTDSVVTRQQLLAAVWGESVHVIDRIIDRHVCSLRQKMGSLSEQIETVPRAGYRFRPNDGQ